VPDGSGTAAFASVRRRTDTQAGEAFDAARAAARRVSDPDLRAALLKQVDAAERQYAAVSEAAAAAVRAVQRGIAGVSQAVGALGAAQRLQAQQAYDLAVAADDALTLHAPVAGVVQLGGMSSGGTTSLTDLLSSGTVPSAPPAASTALPGVDSAVAEGSAVNAGTPILTVVDVGRLGLAADVDETDVLLVKPGGTATAELDAATGATYRATVRAVDLLPTTSAQGGVSPRGRSTWHAGGAEAPRPGPDERGGRSGATGRARYRAGSRSSRRRADTVWAVRTAARAGAGDPGRAGRGRGAGDLRPDRRAAGRRVRRRPGQPGQELHEDAAIGRDGAAHLRARRRLRCRRCAGSR
jgi:hypothetical protein